jgi:competence protein ComEA
LSPPHFSRSQIGVVLLLGAALFFLWAWRGNFGLAPAHSPQKTEAWVFVEVTGEVAHPGVHAFPRPPTLLEAVDRAGGSGFDASTNPTLASGSRVEIESTGRCRLGRMAGPQLLTLGLAVNINEASQSDLEALPGLGPALAGRIIAHRREHGPFRRIDDLQQISGLGPKNLEQIRPYLTLGTAK